jgi:beta-lactamase regulating signal transducer with metallopeptidase domain
MWTSVLRASVTGTVAVALVWMVCRLVPRLSASTRAVLWWCVAAKFVIGLVWLPAVPLPILPAEAPARQGVTLASIRQRVQRARMDQLSESLALRGFTAVVLETRRMTIAPSGQPVGPSFIRQTLALVGRITHWPDLSTIRSVDDRVLRWVSARAPTAFGRWIVPWRYWPDAFLVVWLLGVLFAMGLAVRHWRRASALVARSTVAPEDMRAVVANLAARMSLSRVPDVRVSTDIDTPLVIGLRRPAVLVPHGAFARLSPRQQEMALCHELAHVKRYDLPLGSVPALAEALFFFHPFARLATREYALSREAACDAAVLDALDAPPHEYGRLLLDLGVATPRMGLSVAGMSSASAVLKRRLVMLDGLPARSRTPRLLIAAAVCVMAIAIVPVRLVARPWASSALPVPATAWQKPLSLTPSVQPWGARRLDYILFRDDGRVIAGWEPWETAGPSQRLHPIVGAVLAGGSATSSGPIADAVAHARQFTKPGEPMLWFRRDGREYVLRDAAILRDVETLWRTPRAIAVGPPATSSPTHELTKAETSRILRLDAKLRELQTELDAVTARLQREPPTSNLDDQVSDLGQQLEALGRDLRQAGIVDTQGLVDRAIATGRATPIR